MRHTEYTDHSQFEGLVSSLGSLRVSMLHRFIIRNFYEALGNIFVCKYLEKPLLC